ncbi:carbon-nitrogen hydrolase family protein [bacterium]|nr:carbon-nitrogen hydrolase family protein [bacterium]
MKIAAVQLSSSADAEENLSRSVGFFEKAKKEKIELLLFPENVLYRGSDDGYKNQAQNIPGKLTQQLGNLSHEFSVSAVWGGVVEKTGTVFYNTSLFFSESGDLIGKYRKIHLFELYNNDQVLFRESDLFNHGNEIINLPYKSFNFGMSICYDLRFPELYRSLTASNANVLLVPSDFTEQTGKAHWLPLLRARAIENLSYVIAANQCGVNKKTNAQSYGYSCIINPWGEVIASLDGEETGLCIAEISLEKISASRKRIRSLKHRRIRGMD